MPSTPPSTSPSWRPFSPSMNIALLNTLFRLATVVVLTPFIGLLERMVCRLLPNRGPVGPEEEDFARLESRFIQHPALAIEQSRQAVENMVSEARANLEDAYYLIHDYQEKKFQFVLHREDIIDKYEDKLGSYLIQLTGKGAHPPAEQNGDQVPPRHRGFGAHRRPRHEHRRVRQGDRGEGHRLLP